MTPLHRAVVTDPVDKSTLTVQVWHDTRTVYASVGVGPGVGPHVTTSPQSLPRVGGRTQPCRRRVRRSSGRPAGLRNGTRGDAAMARYLGQIHDMRDPLTLRPVLVHLPDAEHIHLTRRADGGWDAKPMRRWDLRTIASKLWVDAPEQGDDRG